MVCKKNKKKDEINLDVWLVIYVDIIILIFIFFVLLYVILVVDMEKFKNIVDVLKG